MAEPYNHYGTLLTDLKRYEDAIQLFEQSIQIDPNNPDPMVNLAWVKQTLGAETQAEKLYMKGNFWHLKSNLNRKRFLYNRNRIQQFYIIFFVKNL
jgi:tetratricopeptide (TPR) repeat protein